LDPFFFLTKLSPKLLQFEKRGQEVKIKRSRKILRHLTVKNDGTIEMRGINRKNAIKRKGGGGGVEIARV
jgi:hypothetical protein